MNPSPFTTEPSAEQLYAYLARRPHLRGELLRLVHARCELTPHRIDVLDTMRRSRVDRGVSVQEIATDTGLVLSHARQIVRDLASWGFASDDAGGPAARKRGRYAHKLWRITPAGRRVLEQVDAGVLPARGSRREVLERVGDLRADPDTDACARRLTVAGAARFR